MINLISISYYYIAIVFLTSESFSLFGDACTLVDFMNVLLQEVCGINLSFKRALPFLNGYAVRSKWSMWDVAVSVWSITASVLAITATMLAVTAAVCATMSPPKCRHIAGYKIRKNMGHMFAAWINPENAEKTVIYCVS